MSDVTVRTNHHDRFFLCGDEIPDAVHAEYDYLDPEDRLDGWAHYLGTYYHVSDFMRTSECSEEYEAGWNGVHGESYFSGVLIALNTDGETYRIGRYYQ